MALHGATALIGAPYKYYSSGVAYIFEHSGAAWTQQAELRDNNAAPTAWFGSTVSLDPDATTGASTALIGAFYTNLSGAANVFTRGGTRGALSQAARTPRLSPRSS